MDVDAYLDRIGHTGTRETTLEVLTALHRAHLETVSFENLSIHDGERIRLDEEWLFDKIVRRRRGGFCYELNGLFAALLRALGFPVSLREARVFGANGEPGIRFDHLVLEVRAGESFLVDVGFGDSFTTPLPYRIDEGVVEGRRSFKLARDGPAARLMRRDAGGEPWLPQFRIESGEFDLSDFASGCEYHQTSPESSFTRGRVCSRLVEDGGRVTLRDRTLIETAPDGTRSERELEDEAAANAVLRERFGIELD